MEQKQTKCFLTFLFFIAGLILLPATGFAATLPELKKPCFGTLEDTFTSTTMIYRSGEVYDPYEATTTTYLCTQGIASDGSTVPISLDCLMPYDNLGSDTKYSFYKKNPDGYTIGTNDATEAYTIREIAKSYEGSNSWQPLRVEEYYDGNKKARLYRVQPTISVNVTLRIDWEQTNYLLQLINADRAEQDIQPLILDANVTEFAILRTAEHYLLPYHQRPNGRFGATDEAFVKLNTGSKLSLSGENAESSKCSWVKQWSYERCKNENNFMDITKEWTLSTHQGYKNSKGHYDTYMKEEHTAAGLSVSSNNWSHNLTPEIFASGNEADIVPLQKSGTEFRTVPVTILDTHFDYYLHNPISTLTVGETHKLANYAAPVNYWWSDTFYTSPELKEEDTAQQDFSPFDFNSLTFESSNPAVATVDSNGFVTGLQEGTATIRCSIQGKHTKEQTITVSHQTVPPTITPEPSLPPVVSPTPPAVTPVPPVLPVAPKDTIQTPSISITRQIRASSGFKKGDKLQQKKKGKWKTIYTFKKKSKEKTVNTKGTYRVIRKMKKKTKKLPATYRFTTTITPKTNGRYADKTTKKTFRGNFKKAYAILQYVNGKWMRIYTIRKPCHTIILYGSGLYKVCWL